MKFNYIYIYFITINRERCLHASSLVRRRWCGESVTTRNWDLEHAGCLVKFLLLLELQPLPPTHKHLHTHIDTNRLTHIQNAVYTILAANIEQTAGIYLNYCKQKNKCQLNLYEIGTENYSQLVNTKLPVGSLLAA